MEFQSGLKDLVAPVMFRFMYCCGLRPCEARNLDRADINFENRRVFIKESKHYRERYVYAPNSLMPVIGGYLKSMDCVFPEPNLYSFRHSFATHLIYWWFKEGKDPGAFLPKLSTYINPASVPSYAGNAPLPEWHATVAAL